MVVEGSGGGCLAAAANGRERETCEHVACNYFTS